MAQWTTTYSGLVSALQDYVEDDTSEYASAVQGCINRAEERLFRDLDLSLFNEQTTTSTSTGVSSYTVGGGESPIQAIFCSAINGHLEPRPYAFIQDFSLGAQGAPCYYFSDETELYLAPTPDATYSLVLTYCTRPTPLSVSNETNWFAHYAADALLWASLVESEAFLIAPERVSEFEANYAKVIGPMRANWRSNAQNDYEPINPTPTPTQTR